MHIRRTLRILLTLVAVGCLLSAHPLGASASPSLQPEPTAPQTAPQPGDPGSGEPDVGNHRPLAVPTTQRSTRAPSSDAGSTVRMVGWSTIVWLRAYFGISFGL